MKMNRRIAIRLSLIVTLAVALSVASSHFHADTGTCGGVSVTLPFTDVPAGNVFFCSIAAAYYSGLTNGTTATTYSPSANVTREQMAAFVTRTLGQSLRRGSRRAALGQLASPTSVPFTGSTALFSTSPEEVKCDGADLWVACFDGGSVARVRASDGKLLETWSGVSGATSILIARGRVFVAGSSKLFVIDPKMPAGSLTPLTSSLTGNPNDMAFDGFNIWVSAHDGAVDKVNPNTGVVTHYTTGFDSPLAITFDGTFMWVSDAGSGSVHKVDLNGNIVQTFITGPVAYRSVFDGINLWVPNFGPPSSLTVLRVCDSLGNPVATPFVLATLTGNGLDGPVQAAFDGERIAVANFFGSSLSLWRAADLAPLGSFTGATAARGICSDGINFWIALRTSPGTLARF